MLGALALLLTLSGHQRQPERNPQKIHLQVCEGPQRDDLGSVRIDRRLLRAREAFGLRVGRSLTCDREQLVRVANLVHAKDHGVGDGEYGRHQPEAERHRRHDCQGYHGRSAERATGVQDVSHDTVE